MSDNGQANDSAQRAGSEQQDCLKQLEKWYEEQALQRELGLSNKAMYGGKTPKVLLYQQG